MTPSIAPSMRPEYHFSVPDNWKNDPQRPIYLDGEYHYYYLYNADYLTGGIGTSWRHATTRDHVSFVDHGVAIEKFTNTNGDCWSGSLVVDVENTAGFGPGAVIALVTQARVNQEPEGGQAQFLWYSTDGGRSFRPGGTDPVLDDPTRKDFRDPKLTWDGARGQWFMALAEGQSLGFYTSPDLSRWSRVGGFARDDLGLLECPDIFEMTADDGSSHWILGVSANAKHRGLPATYAYWTGSFDGSAFVPDTHEPRWLDWGFDFYGAVTYPHHEPSGVEDPTLRHVIGWANFWDYPHNTPTTTSDGYNGDDMIVRDLRLVRDNDGFVLASEPTAALTDYAKRTHHLGDLTVDGHLDLDIHARAYDLSCEIDWHEEARLVGDIGFEVCRASEGSRFITAGVDLSSQHAYLDRTSTVNPTRGRTTAPVDAGVGPVSIRLLVDRTSVEMFVGHGRTVQSHRVFPLAGDDGIRLFARDTIADFRDVTIREISVPDGTPA